MSIRPLILSSSLTYGQLRLSDLEKFNTNSLDGFVENLTNRGFVFQFRQDDYGTSMRLYYPKINGGIRAFYMIANQKDNNWEFTFDKNYHANFLKIQSHLKNKYTKTRYFYSYDYGIYVTEYIFNENYIYIGKGNYSDASGNISDSFDIIYVTNRRMK